MEYKIKTAHTFQIAEHLKACANAFVPALSQRVDINSYAHKIFDNAQTFEAWEDSILIGLLAIYINVELRTGFITNISVLNKYSQNGIGKSLMNNCIFFLKNKNIQILRLEVGTENKFALEWYKRFNFIEKVENSNTTTLELNIV